jgi:2-succinyl-5-enolpyruvyl-6-hydroxy-3-cyclohexene-1-carboxylate synthase
LKGGNVTDWQSAFAATFVDELVRNGVTDAVISPGKRATLVAAAIERDERIRTHVFVDERSGSFFALGLARKTSRPTLLWCTSGTAAAEYYPAVIEASYSRVPLIVATGDRPVEQHSVRDWQSMDQTHLYGNATRWFFDFGTAEEGVSGHWRSMISRGYFEAVGGTGVAGPVHFNVPIREPFSLLPVEPVPGRADGQPWHRSDAPQVSVNQSAVDELVEKAKTQRGVFLLGAGPVDTDAVHAAADALGWPVLAQTRSAAHAAVPEVIGAADVIVRNETFTNAHVPDVFVHVGAPLLISRPTMAYFKATPAEEWSVEANPSWQGHAQKAARIVASEPSDFFRAIARSATRNEDRSWLDAWRRADHAVQEAISETLDAETALTEAAVARSLFASLPSPTNLFCSTSMPVRNIDWWSKPREGVQVFANRGVSGLEGITSTALGVAAASESTESNVLFIGDLGALYDINGLWTSRGSSAELQLTIVLVDNNGGGIFRVFPHLSDELSPEVYDRVVTTSHNVDIPRVLSAFDIDVLEVDDISSFRNAVIKSIESGGVRVVYCKTDAQRDLAMIKKVVGATTKALAEI